MPNCKQCNTGFEITDEDRKFYKQISVPEPTLCPACRRQRRLSWRNERILYKRKCSKTGKDTFSIYPKDAPFPVYSPEAWYSDDWDPRDFGQEFDFSRPFFDQFYELQKKVPRISNILTNTINCDYCNVIGDCKNCYLIFGSIHCEDCMYGNPYYSKNCIDSLVVRYSELCYECVDCEKLYECFFCQNCTNSQNLQFCFDVEGSHDCFLCTGLRRAEYHILNQSYSKEDYKKKVAELRQKDPETLMQQLQELKQKTPVKYMVGTNNENVTGDIIFQSRNCRYLFQGEKCEEIHYSTQIIESHHCMDCDYGEVGDFAYEVSGFYKVSHLLFCHWCWEAANLHYCSTCTLNTKNCFGCISLRHNQYCILNKQYKKEEYEKLVPKIIEHMKKTGEWGEFFPIKYSPFAYNESVAQEYFLLTKEEVQKKCWLWRDETEKDFGVDKIVDAKQLSFDINQIPDDILNWAIRCEVTGRLFRITPQELKFYKQFKLPIPHFHPDERHRRRMALRNPHKLWDRKCAKCQKSIQTTYSPDRPEKVYCEQCYLKEVY